MRVRVLVARLTLATSIVGLGVNLARAEAILNGALTPLSENTLKDADGEWITPSPSSTHTEFAVGDQVTEVLTFLNLTNLHYNQKPLTELFGSNYQLSSVAHLTLTSMGPVTTANSGQYTGDQVADVKFTGTVSVYETTNPANHIDFTTQDRSTMLANASAGNKILNLSGSITGFQVPVVFSQIPTTSNKAPQFVGGFNITSNPGDVPIASGGENTVNGVNDVSVILQAFFNTGANTANIDLNTNTTAAFMTTPEPGSLLIWTGLIGTVGIVEMRRRRRTRMLQLA